MAYFAVVVFVNPKGFGCSVLLTRKGCFVTNVLDSSLDLGSNMFETGMDGGPVLDSLMFQVC